jgi:hypothetical protein
VITVFSYAIGPFVQQAITSELCSHAIPSVNATIPLAMGLDVGSTIADGERNIWQLDTATTAVIVGALADGGINRAPLVTGCTSGNCTFEHSGGISYSTIGYCSMCVDTSDLIQETIPAKNSNLPMVLSGPTGIRLRKQSNISLNISTTYYGPDEYPALKPLAAIANFTVAPFSILAMSSAGCTFDNANATWHCTRRQHQNFSATWNSVNIVSASCSIFACHQSYSAEVINGELQERLINSIPVHENVPKAGHLGAAYVVVDQPCASGNMNVLVSNSTIINSQHGSDDQELFSVTDGVKLQAIPLKCINKVGRPASESLRQSLEDFTTGDCGSIIPYIADSTAPGYRRRVICRDRKSNNAWWLASLNNNGNATFESISKHVRGVADVMTDHLRRGTYDPSNAKTFALGTVDETTVCTRFVWQWLLLPASLLVLTLGFFLSTVACTIRERGVVPLWKSSVLPFVYATSDDLRVSAPATSAAMESTARVTDVELSRGGGEAWPLRKRSKPLVNG